MVDDNKMRALEEYSRRTSEEIQEIRAEVKTQGTELYKKLEQLQLQMETVLSALNSLKANQDSERENVNIEGNTLPQWSGHRGDIVGIQESNRGGYNMTLPKPFSNGELRGGADLGSGSVARNGNPASESLAPSMTSTSVEVVIPQKLLTHVHGENDSNLTQIRQISGANVLIHDPKPGATEGVVVVSGTSDQMRVAQSLIHAFILYGQTIH